MGCATLTRRPAARPLMTETRRRVVGTSRDASRALASALAMAAPAPASASLVRVDALDRVFDIIDANRDGSLTVQEFILVRPPASPRRRAKNARSVPSFSSPGVGDPRVRGARGGHSASRPRPPPSPRSRPCARTPRSAASSTSARSCARRRTRAISSSASSNASTETPTASSRAASFENTSSPSRRRPGEPIRRRRRAHHPPRSPALTTPRARPRPPPRPRARPRAAAAAAAAATTTPPADPPLRRRSRRSTRSGLPPRPAPGAASP